MWYILKFIIPFRCLDMVKMIFTDAGRDNKELRLCVKIEFNFLENISGHQNGRPFMV